MRIAQTITAADAYDAHRRGGHSARQRELIMRFIKLSGGDWSIGELAHALNFQKSTVSARINELLYEGDRLLVECPRRRDRRSGITIRPVGLPVVGQQVLF